MRPTSSGVAMLVVGTSATLLFGLFSTALAARSAPVRQLVTNIVDTFSPAPQPPPDPWFLSYRALLPVATSTLDLRGTAWRLSAQDGSCWILRREAKEWQMVTSADVSVCVLGGGSIDGRHLTIGRAEQGECLADAACIDAQSGAWHLYDDRPRIVREVPKPIPDGYWAAIDPVRNMGLYVGKLSSTLTKTVTTRYWVTDEAGAALWSGDRAKIDADAIELLPLRIISRADGALLMSYRARGEDSIWSERLAVLRPARLQDGWKPVEVPHAWSERVWRLDDWQGGVLRSEVVLKAIEGAGITSTRVRVAY